MPNSAFRKTLSLPGLLNLVRHCFNTVPDPKQGCAIPLADHLMSALAIFGLKYPSLLQFDQDHTTKIARANLQSLYGIEHVPSDTYLRERLDDIDPANLRQSFTRLFSAL